MWAVRALWPQGVGRREGAGSELNAPGHRGLSGEPQAKGCPCLFNITASGLCNPFPLFVCLSSW